MTRIHVDATRIVNGEVGPRHYYALDQPDEKSAQEAYETALLRAAILRRSKGTQ